MFVGRRRAARPEDLDDEDIIDPVALMIEQHHEIIGVRRRDAEGLGPSEVFDVERHEDDS
jgi:hypothetical protein